MRDNHLRAASNSDVSSCAPYTLRFLFHIYISSSLFATLLSPLPPLKCNVTYSFRPPTTQLFLLLAPPLPPLPPLDPLHLLLQAAHHAAVLKLRAALSLLSQSLKAFAALPQIIFPQEFTLQQLRLILHVRIAKYYR